MKKIILITIAALMLSTMLMARNKTERKESPARMNKEMSNMPMMNHMAELKLTPQQKDKFDKLRADFVKSKNLLSAEIKNLHVDKQAAIKAEDFKRSKEINKQIAAKKTAMMDAHIDHMEAMLKELSAEQKVIAKEMFPRMMKRGRLMDDSRKGNCDGDCEGNCEGGRQGGKMRKGMHHGK